ncbi:SRPBCC domain-containing protein [Chitinophaga eiseniae]|uniref:ATPase n=1 Tax=Chitinophaga eiseniae TaxID=634771 RepID=A0A847SL94_9BACT|nr:SRPBCC domain-containing protein [Chitinophaga eiseniae]NLR78166.1 ATPase [Chitinophaga eiseniae]
MEQKTKVNAEDGKQELFITREFDLPLELLFTAYTEPEIVEQWMGTKVLQLESRKYGSYQFETSDPKGNKYRFSGVAHEFIPNQKIVRTFEMEGTPFGLQLEFYEFEAVTDSTSKLRMHVIYESVEKRDAVIKQGMVRGIDLAHNRIEKILQKQL